MRHIGFYARKLYEQIKICMLMFGSLKKFMQHVKEEEGVNIILLFIVLFLQLGCNMKGVLNGKFILIVAGLIISNFLFCTYMWCLVYLAKGKQKLHHMVNVSLYVHILYICINLFFKMGFIEIAVYFICNILAIIIQMGYLKIIFKCEYERVKNIFYIEVGIIIFTGVSSLMAYVGNEIIYMKKFPYYLLLE